MKTSLLLFLTLLTFHLTNAQSNGTSTPPRAAIEVDFGASPDCRGRGRQCLSVEMVSSQDGLTPSVDALGELYEDSRGRVVFELSQVFEISLWNELESGVLTLVSPVNIPASLIPNAPENSPDVVIQSGVYSAYKLKSGAYMVVF